MNEPRAPSEQNQDLGFVLEGVINYGTGKLL